MTTPMTGEEPPDNPVLRLRITHITSSMSAPLHALNSTYLAPHLSTAIPAGILPHHMPVLRIFGTTPSLQKICANIHLCYPYFYVPYPMDSTDPLRPERVIKLCQRFAVSLNHAICLAMRQNPTSAGNKYGGGTDPKHLHVVSVQLVKGVPFYGYHIGYSYFLKVSLVNPSRIYVALEQLRKPAVLGREWQPHEAHMNHVLQFMCDFDLYGCGWLNLSGGTFREPLPGASPSKDTFAPLEIDILPNQIMNRRRLKPRALHHDFIELLRQPLDPKEKLVPAVAELWEDERRRRTAKGLSLDEGSMLPGGGMGGRNMEELGYKLPGKEYNENKGGNWKISDEYWKMIQERMNVERSRKGKMTFERLSSDALKGREGEKRVYDKWVPTAFEAVSSHWPVLPGDPKSTQRSKRSRFKASSNAAPSSPIPAPLSSPGALVPSSPLRLEQPVKVEGDDADLEEGGPFAKIEPDQQDPDPIQGHLFNEGDPHDDSDGEENPFHLYAMTQVVVESDLKPDINPNLIARQNGSGDAEGDFDDAEEAEYEAQERRHAEDARIRAEAGIKARATQKPRSETGEGEGSDEFDDDELDELFRRTVMPGAPSAQTTPRKNRQNGGGTGSRTGSFTPTTRSGGSKTSVDTPSTGGRSGYGAVEMQERRANREMRMRNEAGWGDLSTILDQSSLNRSSPHSSNPYHGDGTRTPPSGLSGGLRQASPASAGDGLPSANGEQTPTHRNPFSKPRTSSPLVTPTKRGAWPPRNTVILPPSRRSATRFSPERDETTPTNVNKPGSSVKMEPGLAPPPAHSAGMPDVKPDIEDLKEIVAELPDADVSVLFAPGQQKKGDTASEKTDSGRTASNEQNPATMGGPTLVAAPDIIVSSQFSPTQVVPDLPGGNKEGGAHLSHSTSAEGTSSQPLHPNDSQDRDAGRPRKRVRMAGPIDEPDNPFSQPIASQASQASQRSERSQLSIASSQSNRLSVHTDTSFVPSAPTVTSDGVPSGTSKTAWTFVRPPPLARDLQEYLDAEGIPTVEYQSPYYSNPVDVPPRAKMFAGRMFSLKGSAVKDLHEFEHAVQLDKEALGRRAVWLHDYNAHPPVVRARCGWEFARPLPRITEVVRWCDEEDAKTLAEATKQAQLTSQLAAPTQKSKFGFNFSQKKKSADSEREAQNMSVLSLEVFATSRHQLLPDPEKDDLVGVFFCYQNDDEKLPDTTRHAGYYAGYCVVDSQQTRDGRARLDDIPTTVVESELDLINWVIDLVKAWDPDVLAGWELHNASWGYLTARAQDQFSIDLTEELSRVVGGQTGPRKDFYSATHASTFKVSGRHILNIWRICRSEINLTQYSFENVVFHLLHQRIPHYPAPTLTALWRSRSAEHTVRVLNYYFQRVVMYCEVIDAAEIITKNAEFARVFGVDFASVMFRGSQYKVESFMFRIAKPESFILVSPSKQQVGLQNAPFAVPLIAEPESKYYNHPIIVLDFQSLYPSVMIAYNICFSTCLGRVEKFKGTDKFGFTELKPADGLLEVLKDYLTVTPNGMIFVKPAVRKSLLSKMLAEILDTRVMIKHAMKGARGNKGLLSLLNARQLGLKLMANVTYGYTSATYSGRMPCIEVADSIVQTGRETLEKAQQLIHSRADWDAQVVYGDTDSLFVALPGRSKDQAFKIGNDIADTVTAMNPKPVKLKFEKVYMGSVLMAKKRYVGFKYEHPDETEPVFDAKGIETIRRDGFPAQQKIEEVCLKMLFRTQDLSQIKEFCRAEWTKILQGRVSIQDFIVAKEVRLGSYSEKGVPPPGAAVAYRRILKDPRDEPQYAERVPYIVSNAEGRRLIDRARMPEEMLANRSLGIDAEYYIRNLLIPPLSRIFNLVGADVEHWYDSMPRTKRAGRYDTAASTSGGGQAFSFSLQGQVRPKAQGRAAGKMRIDSHFKSSHCIVCGAESASSICAPCRSTPAETSHTLLSREHIAQQRLMDIHKLCASCSSTPVGEKILCDSIDCPITYTRTRAQRDVQDIEAVRGAMGDLDLEGTGEEAGREMGWGDSGRGDGLEW